MRLRFMTCLKISLFILIVSSALLLSQAQNAIYCYLHQISDIKWSPDGELLAVMTIQGVHIYDSNLSLLRTIEAPKVIPDFTSRTGLVWSPDSQWVILPDHTTPEIAVQRYSGWTVANAYTGELREITSPFEVGERSHISEIVWSPDNSFIIALKHEPELGLPAPYTMLVRIGGIREGNIQPWYQRFNDLRFSNLQWSEDIISVQQDGIRLFLNFSLELLETPPVLYPSWWRENQSGTFEAGQSQVHLLIREVGGESHEIILDEVVNSAGEFLMPGIPDTFIWQNDSENITAIYGIPVYLVEQYPELENILQGAIINARTIIQEHNFILQAEADIDGYSVSTRGDRIALYHSDLQLELWNPITEERLASIEIAPLTNMDDC